MPAQPDDNVLVATESPRIGAALLLMERLSKELAALYDDDGSGSFAPEDVEAARGAFVIARIGERPVGCGAIRLLKDDIGEVKRIFVESEFRGRGVGRKILEEIETLAAKFGYERLWLEVGIKQPEAIALYERAGYTRISCYGKYTNDPLSVCFEKRLR